MPDLSAMDPVSHLRNCHAVLGDMKYSISEIAYIDLNIDYYFISQQLRTFLEVFFDKLPLYDQTLIPVHYFDYRLISSLVEVDVSYDFIPGSQVLQSTASQLAV